MRSSTSLAVLFLTFASSLLSAFLLYSFMDVEKDFVVAYASMGLACFLAVMSSAGMAFYLFKYLLYRGDVTLGTLMDSVRQGAFVAVFALCAIALYAFHIFTYTTVGLLTSTIVFLELMVGSLRD